VLFRNFPRQSCTQCRGRPNKEFSAEPSGHRVKSPLDTSTLFVNSRLNRCPMEFAPPESTESPLFGLGVRNRTGVRGFSAPCSLYVASNPSRPSMLQRFFSDQ
jgi:hypothetical protein